MVIAGRESREGSVDETRETTEYIIEQVPARWCVA